MPPPAIHFTFSLCSLLSVLFSTLIRLNFGLSRGRTSSIYFSLSDLFHLTSTFQFSACCWKDGISFFFWQQNFIEYRQQLLFTDLSVAWILSLAIVNKAMINSTCRCLFISSNLLLWSAVNFKTIFFKYWDDHNVLFNQFRYSIIVVFWLKSFLYS